MSFVVVSEGGELAHHRQPPTAASTLKHVGPPAHIRLHALPTNRQTMHAYTPKASPIRWRRNPVGACVLASFGAPQYPYAGPVVLVGSDRGRIGSLPRWLSSAVVEVHARIRLVLAGSRTVADARWEQAVWDYAEYVDTAEGPLWADHPATDLFGRDKIGRSWWLCPTGRCGCAAMFHQAGVCRYTGCTCGKETR